VNATITQRIIRKLNPEKAVSVPLNEEQKSIIQSKLPPRYHHLIPDTIMKADENIPSSEAYLGIMAIFEVLVLSQTIKDLILTQASTAKIKALAIEEGMTTLEVSGILKVLDHTTDFAEIERVLGIKIF
jgi:type II secretory ATPase GspE/PulE/Tfp pilus assembly ATPase PilB-like protein